MFRKTCISCPKMSAKIWHQCFLGSSPIKVIFVLAEIICSRPAGWKKRPLPALRLIGLVRFWGDAVIAALDGIVHNGKPFAYQVGQKEQALAARRALGKQVGQVGIGVRDPRAPVSLRSVMGVSALERNHVDIQVLSADTRLRRLGD